MIDPRNHWLSVGYFMENCKEGTCHLVCPFLWALCLDLVVHAKRLVLPPGLPFIMCLKGAALSLNLYLVAQSSEFAAAIFVQWLSMAFIK